MQSTTVAVGGKGSNPKTVLYVGGLEESVNEAILHSAFIPFGKSPNLAQLPTLCGPRMLHPHLVDEACLHPRP